MFLRLIFLDSCSRGSCCVSIVLHDDQCLNNWVSWTTSGSRPFQPWAKDAARGNLFPFITPNYVGGLEEIGSSVAVTDMLLITAGQGNSTTCRDACLLCIYMRLIDLSL